MCPQIPLLPLPQIQKLAERSDVISEVPKCSKIQIFDGGAYSARTDHLDDVQGARCPPPQEAHPRSRSFGHRFYGSQGLTHYRVGNPTNDRFQM